MPNLEREDKERLYRFCPSLQNSMCKFGSYNEIFALVDKLVKEDKWEDFIKHTNNQEIRLAPKDIIDLFRPYDKYNKPQFVWLVSEYLKTLEVKL